jgi:sigma-B regulation protein RsbU (phosphoserine phosphatase)
VRILIAEDDLIPRRLLKGALTDWGHEVVVAADGLEALTVLHAPDAPKLAVLDWMMPGMDGVDVCRRIRGDATSEPTYLILLTGRGAKEDIVAGLHSGANDYVTKPFDRAELRARIQVGCQVVELQASLAARVRELEAALTEVKQLQELLPICSYCQKVRDDQNYWQKVDQYLARRADFRLSHGICPDCWQNVVAADLQRMGITPPPAPAV